MSTQLERTARRVLVFLLTTVAVAAWPSAARGQTPEAASLLRAVDAYNAGTVIEAGRLLARIDTDGLSDRDRAIRALYLGFVALFERETDRAREWLEEAVRADPSVRPDPALHAPSRIRAYQRARQAVAEEQRVATLSLTLPSDTIDEGDQTRIRATARNRLQAEVATAAVRWRASPAGVASVSEDGVVRGLGAGTARIVGEADGVRDSVRLTVRPSVAEIAVRPDSLHLVVTGQARLEATARADDGTPLDARPVGWSSIDRDVATVDPTGRVRARTPGRTAVSAAVGGVTRRIPVTVVPRPVAAVELNTSVVELQVGEATDLRAVTRAEDGSVLAGRAVAWSSSDSTVAVVDTRGNVRARSVGQARVHAAAEEAQSEVRVVVLPETHNVGSIVMLGLVIPGAGELSVGHTGRGLLALAAGAGAVAAGALSKKVEVVCARPVETADACPSPDVLEQTETRPYLLHGIGAAAGVALIAAIDAALAAASANERSEELRARGIGGSRSVRAQHRPRISFDGTGRLTLGWSVRF